MIFDCHPSTGQDLAGMRMDDCHPAPLWNIAQENEIAWSFHLLSGFFPGDRWSMDSKRAGTSRQLSIFRLETGQSMVTCWLVDGWVLVGRWVGAGLSQKQGSHDDHQIVMRYCGNSQTI